jgi:hypothetical protein
LLRLLVKLGFVNERPEGDVVRHCASSVFLLQASPCLICLLFDLTLDKLLDLHA